MASYDADGLDHEECVSALEADGYVVIEGVLAGGPLAEVREAVEGLLRSERQHPYEPGDLPTHVDDDEIEAYLDRGYAISADERARLMRRIRYTRHANLDTPWPVGPESMNKSFLHLPTLFDDDASQRVWNLPAKLTQTPMLLEDDAILPIVRRMLGEDCVLSDLSATSIGPHTLTGGSWHVDAPLTQMEDPLPEAPLTVQNAWMLDDFTADNGATRVVPGSHLRRKKPTWGSQKEPGEVVLTGRAGSVAIWLSQTWHRSGPNVTDSLRRAILSYSCRSWIKPFTEFTRSVPEDVARSYSETVRYLLGWSAFGPRRG